MPPGSNNSTEIYKAPRDRHRRFAEQAVADHLVKTEIAGNGRTVATWSTHEHNEMGDCLAMCGAFASLGEKLVDVAEKAEKPVETAQKAPKKAENAPEKAEKTPENAPKTPVQAPRRRRVMMPGWH